MLWLPRGSDGYDADTAADFVSDYTARHGLPGAAYVVVRDGKLVDTGGAGDVSARTPMSVGSLAKSFTAFAVLQLVDRGKLDLDEPVTDVLPDFTVQGADAAQITLRMLLSHTSGLPNPLLVAATGSLEEDVDRIGSVHVSTAPGTAYSYSNLNDRVLARVVEVAAEQDFDAYLSRHIFGPLGMDHTSSVVTAGLRDGLDAGRVTAYGLSLPLPELATDVVGSGGVISTAEDMGAWLAMQQRGGTTADGTRLLSTSLVEQSRTSQPRAGTYAMGWQGTSTADPARIGHDGAMTRYSARQDPVPSDGYAVAVLLDSYTPTYRHPFAISTGLIDVAEGRVPELGMPVATIIDFVLGAITILVLVLGARGVQRADRWTARRAHHRWWRRLLRLVPQTVMPAIALLLVVGLTVGADNPATPLDVVGLWPAALILVPSAATVGAVLIVVRLRSFRRQAGAHGAVSDSPWGDPTPERG